MAERAGLGADEHREVRELLPWYVTDGLEPEERARVEAHLARHPELMAELKAEERLAAEIRAIPDEEVAERQAWAALASKLSAEAAPAAPAPRPARGPAPCPGRRTGARSAAGLGRRGAQFGAALAVAASVALAVVLLPEGLEQPADPGAPFGTLTSPEARPEGPVLMVMPAAGVGAGEVAAIAASHGLRVVSGPSEGGLYTLAPSPAADLAPIAAALSARAELAGAIVRIAE